MVSQLINIETESTQQSSKISSSFKLTMDKSFDFKNCLKQKLMFQASIIILALENLLLISLDGWRN